jgi:group I intron endonuclease
MKKTSYVSTDENSWITPLNSHNEEGYAVLNSQAGLLDSSWIFIITKWFEPKFTVYMHINKINGKKYIGLTFQTAKKRWGYNGNHYNKKFQSHFYKSIKKYGWDNFEHIIVLEGLTEQEAKILETNLIIQYNTINPKYGYNLKYNDNAFRCFTSNEIKKKISKKNKNKFVSDETRKKLSILYTGKNHHMYGKKQSEETKQKKRIAMTGKKLSKETKLKISLSHKGKKLTKEHKLKISLGGKGLKRSIETRRKIGLANLGEKNYNFGKPAWNRGRPHPQITRNKIRQALLQRFKLKENNYEE